MIPKGMKFIVIITIKEVYITTTAHSYRRCKAYLVLYTVYAVCMVTRIARVWINPVRLLILLVVS